MEKRKITLPLTRELAKTLHAGDQVLVTGTIYTSRDAGHKRMCEALARGEKIPFDPTDATIYYVGPTPAKPGQVIGSAGPTTSGRMDAYAPTMMSVGARGMIGKGARLPEVVEAMKKYDGVYFGAIGGAGAQKEIFAAIIKYLIPYIREQKAALYVNVGDYKNVWEALLQEIPEMKSLSTEHFDYWEETEGFAQKALDADQEVTGIHGFWHANIFEAVYCTNLLMRSADVLVTKPSELAFYPIPKLFIKRVGKHEMWGAIHSAEIGDGTLECRDIPHTLQMVDMFLNDDLILSDMCDNIMVNKSIGIYDGAYKVVELAMGMKENK